MNLDESFLYQQIADDIRNKIISGTLQPGDRLPPIRSLVEEWDCTPGTIQRAYQELVRQGLLISRPGKGTFVLDSIQLPQDAHLRMAALVHRAESFLLEVFTTGYSTEEVKQAVSIALDRWQSLATDTLPQPTQKIRFSGSHDLALKWLSENFSLIDPNIVFQTEFSGSLGGLLSLAQGNADLAGSHLWDPETDSYNDAFIRKIFPGHKMAAITLARRNLGLIVMPGNPKKIHTIADLAKPGVVFVNRQTGSGTRVWFDIQLERAGIPKSRINGYENTRITHSELARNIASGQADVGIGLQGISAAFGLEFIKLTEERYELVTYADVVQKNPFKRLQQALTDPMIRESLCQLEGYNCEESGTIRFIE